MRYAFIEEHRRVWPVRIQCAVLEVTRSGFYAWRHCSPSQTQQRREALSNEVKAIHAEPDKDVYGAPRLQRELAARGHRCNRKTVAKAMKQAGIQAKTTKSYRVTITDSNHPHPVAENIMNRDFAASTANEKWVADITYVATGEGWLYLAAVMDLCSRQIVGWSMSDHIDSRLVVDALAMSLARSQPGDGLIAHSDRGVQSASEHDQSLLSGHGITCSMSRRGNCRDNAPMESFFATLKKELVHHEQYATRRQARQSLFAWIETFYNRVRLHSAICYRSPAQLTEPPRQTESTPTSNLAG